MPLSGSMYQSVSSATCWSPLDCDPALIVQMLNQPAFFTVPSGFSRISRSFLGMSWGIPCARPARREKQRQPGDRARNRQQCTTAAHHALPVRLFSGCICRDARGTGVDEQHKCWVTENSATRAGLPWRDQSCCGARNVRRRRPRGAPDEDVERLTRGVGSQGARRRKRPDTRPRTSQVRRSHFCWAGAWAFELFGFCLLAS